jgi:hypothetical protein
MMAYVERMRPPNDTSEPARTYVEQSAVRSGFVVLAAVLTEVVVIGALGNQWLTERAAQWILNEDHSALARNFKIALITYNWRFAPLSDDAQHTWLSQLLLIAVTLALTAAFASVLVRGPARFGRVFLACTLAAFGATTLGCYVRALINDQPLVTGSRFEKTVFGPLSPNALSVFAGVVLALLAGLVAGLVATVLHDRAGVAATPAHGVSPPVDAYVPPEQPEPFFPDPPRTRPSPAGQTTRFPRPPDDEDLGHEHD